MQVYVNRAKKISDSSFVYWTTEDSSDSNMSASNAPSPSSAYTDVVTIGMRSVRSSLKMQDLSAQCNGSNQSFTLSEAYASGSLVGWWNGQQQRTGSGLEIEETSTTTFTTSFTAPTDSVMVVGYRPL
jgi:hypothetical protein